MSFDSILDIVRQIVDITIVWTIFYIILKKY